MVCGAIPVVPDLYGFRETVLFAELRYKLDDMISATTMVVNTTYGDFNHFVSDLIKHASQYTADSFLQTLLACLRAGLF